MTGLAASLATAQDPAPPVPGAPAIQLYDAPPTPGGYPVPVVVPSPSLPTAAELRRAQAIYQSQMRLARIEAAQWMGYHLLRPNLPANPMMTSRYAPRRTIVIPVYLP